jgi:hypothetical protein
MTYEHNFVRSSKMISSFLNSFTFAIIFSFSIKGEAKPLPVEKVVGMARIELTPLRTPDLPELG